MRQGGQRLDAAQKMNGTDLERIAEAIAFHESRNDDSKVGRTGQRGRYQLQAQLWAQITHEPFEKAHEFAAAHFVMMRHLRWLRAKLRNFRSLERSDVGLIALAWCAGPQAVLYLFADRYQKACADFIEQYYHERSGSQITHAQPGNDAIQCLAPQTPKPDTLTDDLHSPTC